VPRQVGPGAGLSIWAAGKRKAPHGGERDFSVWMGDIRPPLGRKPSKGFQVDHLKKKPRTGESGALDGSGGNPLTDNEGDARQVWTPSTPSDRRLNTYKSAIFGCVLSHRWPAL